MSSFLTINNMKAKGIFIGATGQDVGKTTACLGILSGLHQRYPRLGFLKPVGQRHVQVETDLHVDKDVVLFKEHFALRHEYADMSPVLLPKGFTRDYLDKKHSSKNLLDKIVSAYNHIASSSDFTIVEGTGHIGVGSIVDLNNARVAAALGLEMVIVVPGGLGSTIDQLALNVAVCQQHGVKVRGVILNRVSEEKREMIQDYIPKALKRLRIPLIGSIPYDHFLSLPSMRDFEGLFGAKLLSGREHQFRRFAHNRLGARSIGAFRESLVPRQLTIAPASREDIIEAVLERHTLSLESDGRDFKGGLILTGRRAPSLRILGLIEHSDVPILYCPISSFNALKMINLFIAKTRKDDTFKVREAIRLMEANIDFDLLTP